jgi:hypothetical protein
MLEKITVLELHLDAPPFGSGDAGTESEEGDRDTGSEGRAAGERMPAPGDGTGSSDPEIEEVGAGDRDAGERTDTRAVGERTSSRPDGVAVDLGDDSGSRNLRLVGMAVASLVVSTLVTVLAYRLFGGEEESDAVESDEDATVGVDR